MFMKLVSLSSLGETLLWLERLILILEKLKLLHDYFRACVCVCERKKRRKKVKGGLFGFRSERKREKEGT